jgi:hypothetical protein
MSPVVSALSITRRKLLLIERSVLIRRSLKGWRNLGVPQPLCGGFGPVATKSVPRPVSGAEKGISGRLF